MALVTDILWCISRSGNMIEYSVIIGGLFIVAFLGGMAISIMLIEMETSKDFLIVYVAGPYWDDTEEGRLANTNAAIDAGIHIYQKCHYAIIPHLGHYVDPRIAMLGYPAPPNDWWYGIDNMILPEADLFLKLGNSRGTNAEAYLAEQLDIPIVYSVNDIEDNCK